MAKAAKKAAAKPPVKRTRKPREIVVPVPEPQPAKRFFLSSLISRFTALPKLYLIGGAVVLLVVLVLIFRGCDGPQYIKKANDREVAKHDANLERLQASYDSLQRVAREKDSLYIVALTRDNEAHAETEAALQDRVITKAEGEQIRERIKQKTNETAKQIERTGNLSDLDVILNDLLRTRDSIHTRRRIEKGVEDR
ncbi:MAG TPA: hypothetical protein VFT06_00290 [Flavisolibacter sp.]|nr:hypothetical protein [Flavisolibacter sp.]